MYVCMYIKLLLVLSGQEKVYRTAPGGSKKIRSPNLTSNTNVENQKKKMRGWTTSDVKKINNLIKTFWSKTFSYLQLFNNKEL